MKYLLDTHPLVFLIYAPNSLSKKARNIIKNDSNVLYIPTLALLEVKYLFEVGKLKGDIADFTHYIKRKTNVLMADFSEGELREALLLESTRDPFDRIILSTAISMDIFILTKDKWMQKKYSKVIW
tara:strand:- start:170 stop:547 length:378 start_codon:yes stop_codon:yes gene_type:complete